MRRLLPLFAVLFVLLLCGSDSPKEYDDGVKVVDELEGTWRDRQEVRVFRSGTYTYRFGNGDLMRGTYRIDRTCKPPHLDLMITAEPSKMQTTIKCIYKVDGDKLRIAYMAASVGDQRPQGFNDDGNAIEFYKSVK